MLPLTDGLLKMMNFNNVTSSGTRRLSEQEIKSVRGLCCVASCLNKASRFGNASRWNLRNPSIISFTVNLCLSLE